MKRDVPDEAGRCECKYRISTHQYHALRCALPVHMRVDPYTLRAGRRGYVVRSLYYETADYAVYGEKMAGDCSRVKYRLRSYSTEPREDQPVRVELKVRRGEALSKHQAFVSMDEYRHFLRHAVWDRQEHPVLGEFARGVHLAGLRPCVLVDYSREGYESRHGDGVRLTFDHAVRSAQARELFPEPAPFFRTHHEHEVVLEIKYRCLTPAWLRDIVQGYGLRLVANSKFTQGIEVGRRDRFCPDGVLVVR